MKVNYSRDGENGNKCGEIKIPRYHHVEKTSCKVAKEVHKMIMENKDKGGLIMVHGSKNSGKTLAAVKLVELIGKELNVICSQPAVDRADVELGYLYSRIGIKTKANSFSTESEILKLFDRREALIIVDDLMFIPYDLQGVFLKQAEGFVKRGGWFLGLGVLHSARNTEFLLTALLMERADKVYTLLANCQRCGKPNAEISQRLIDGKEVGSGTPEIMPPSSHVSYEPRCWECFEQV